MKFDVVIGNPPYDRSLHLKILKKTMEFTDFENGGEIVWLHPSSLQEKQWWRDDTPFAKFRDDFEKNIASVEYVDKFLSNEMFEIALEKDLVITVLNKNGGYDYNKFRLVSPIHNKTIRLILDKKIPALTDVMVGHAGNGGIVMNIPGVHGHAGKPDMWEITSKDYQNAISVELCPSDKTLHNIFVFKTEEERRNFHGSLNTTFYRFWIYSIKKGMTFRYGKYLPWMGEAVNPRTGLKGYQGEWTDEDFFEYFGLTDDERGLVEEAFA